MTLILEASSNLSSGIIVLLIGAFALIVCIGLLYSAGVSMDKMVEPDPREDWLGEEYKTTKEELGLDDSDNWEVPDC